MNLQENINRIKQMMGLNEVTQDMAKNIWANWKINFEKVMKELPETSGVTVNLNNFTPDNPVEILVDGRPFIPSNMSFGFISHLQDTDKHGIGDYIFKVEKFISNNFNMSVFSKLPKTKRDEVYKKMINAVTIASNEIRKLV